MGDMHDMELHKQKMQPVFEELKQYHQADEVRLLHQKTQQLENEQQAVQLEQQERRPVYEQFLREMVPLPPTFEENRTNVPNEKAASKKEKRKEKKQIKKAKEEYARKNKELKADPRLLSKEDLNGLSVFKTAKSREEWGKKKLSHSKSTREETLRKVFNQEDYSNFENLDAVMRNLAATRELKKFKDTYQIDQYSDPAVICQQVKARGGVPALLNPALRLGLSLAQKNIDKKGQKKAEGIPVWFSDFCGELDEAMSTEVMVETLTHQADEATVQQYFRQKGAVQPDEAANKAIVTNKAQQIQIAKRLLLMQLSDFQKIENGQASPWDHSMAVALSHCSRVALTLPKGDGVQEKYMWDSIFNIRGQNLAEDNKRKSSTHSIERRKVAEQGIFTTSKEKKVKFNFSGQRGMNCAIGGLGNAGISGKTIANDGSCGHFYSMYKEGDAEHFGTMLMGLESDAYGVTNQMGHTHDLFATGENASSLGGQRTDEIGDKYGGRQCDLTAYNARQIETFMIHLEAKMRDWQQNGDEHGEMEQLMRQLAGKKLTGEELQRLKNSLQ